MKKNALSPLFYKMEGYKIFLCDSDPYRSGASPILSFACNNNFKTDDNPKDIIIPLGEEVDLLDGEELLLPIGSYSHAVLIGGNHLAVKHNVEFVARKITPKGLQWMVINQVVWTKYRCKMLDC